MKIKNIKNKTNYLNFRDAGIPKRVLIPAGKIADVISLSNMSQIINFGDFQRGFFEVVVEKIKKEAVSPKALKTKEEPKKEDAFDKLKKEVKEYTDNKKNKN